MTVRKIFTRLFFLSTYTWPSLVLAEEDFFGGGGSFRNPIKPDNITELIQGILGIIVQIGLPIIVLMLVYVGYLFVAARGAPDKLKDAKTAFLWTVVGAAVVLGAFVISSAIETTVKNLK